MKNLYSIGEVSKIKGVTIKALRYYHKMGILEPSYIDESSGYRYYSIEQFIYIDIIKVCRALGTSIEELQKIFKECDTDTLLEFLQKKKVEAQEAIIKMQKIVENIDELNEGIKRSKEAVCNDEIKIQHFNKRYIVVSECKEIGDLKELLYYSDLDKIIEENQIKVNMDRGIIYNIKIDGTAEPVFVFNGIIENTNIDDKCLIQVLPEGEYLVLSYKKENEAESIRKLLAYIQKHELQIESLLELELCNDLFNIDKESYSCQIQILLNGSD